MFAKLLKHDVKAVFKYWWLGAGISIIVAIFGGFCMKIANVDYTKYEILPTLGMIGVVLTRIGLYLFPLFTTILVVVRYYKHFFTDEGYLTFTLPVKKNLLLDSKIATSFIFSFMSSVLSYLNLFLIMLIGNPEIIGTDEMAYEFSTFGWLLTMGIFGVDSFADFLDSTSSFAVPYIILLVLIAVAAVIVQTLFIYACITLASSIVKKHKVLTAVGLYYGASSVVTFLLLVFMILGVFSTYNTTEITEGLSEVESFWFTLLMFVGVLGVLLAVISALYLLLTYLLDKKLNLE
ncbi:MAG: hypothetical protein IJD93_01085 [Ruminococcus sp.]|nr:hypothetical protein [Ruminococcus sp.]